MLLIVDSVFASVESGKQIENFPFRSQEKLREEDSIRFPSRVEDIVVEQQTQ